MADYLTRWDPFREVVTLREAMDRLFEDSQANGRRARQMGNGSAPGRRFRLPLDAYVTPEEIVDRGEHAGRQAGGRGNHDRG